MFDTLGDAEKTLLFARTEEFQKALARDAATNWEPFLAGFAGDARLMLLANFVARDLSHRWSKGERPAIEDYLARYPELGPGEKVPPALILEEHRCRVRAGESLESGRYRERFPAQFPAIEDDLNRSAVGNTVVAPTSARRWEAAADARVSVSHQYELVRELGRGMYGEVWLARSPSGIMKAIKILLQAADREAGQRELKSLELIKNLRHPYLLATEDFWTANNRLHIVMELAEGTLRGLLKAALAQGKPGIPPDELFQYIAEAAEGLDFLHSQKVTHRDVKPDNILILHGHAKVADFGLARAQEQGLESMSLAGTPAYMAPEIWGGAGGPASDLYSLAFAYVELRQGRSPLKPRPLVELMVAHQEGNYEFTDTVTPAERTVLRKALAAKPHDRHPTCTDFAAALAAALGRPFASGAHRVAGRTNLAAGPYFGSAGAFDSGSLPMPVDTDAVGGTQLIDSLAHKAEPVAEPQPDQVARARRAWPLIAFGALALAAVVAVAVFLITQGGTKPVSTEAAELTAKKAPDLDPQPKPKPTEADPKPTPVEPKPIEPKPVEPKPKELPGSKAYIEAHTVFPARSSPADDAKRVQLSPTRYAAEWVFVEKAGGRVRFRLITGPSVAPFYIMETKVTNKLYSGGDDAPVMNISAADARAFALKEFGGDLPTALQWDHAAGYFAHDRGDEAPLFTGAAWLGKDVPGPVTRAAGDVNRFGLLDMGGNGREWTRTALPPFAGGKLGELRDLGRNDQPGASEKLILRGRSYTLDRPLTYALLKNEITFQPQAANGTASPFTGFRVVLPLP